jgi:hypothetical protein
VFKLTAAKALKLNASVASKVISSFFINCSPFGYIDTAYTCDTA